MALRYCLQVPLEPEHAKRIAEMADSESPKAVLEKVLGRQALPGSPSVLRFPNLVWFRGGEGASVDYPGHLIVQLAFDDAAAVKAFVGMPRSDAQRFRFGRDPRIAIADAWLPNGWDAGVFGNRAMAHALIGADALRAAGAKGQGVNVAIVDMGVDRNWVKATRRRLGASDDAANAPVHGWSRFRYVNENGGRRRAWHNAGEHASEHGHMIARTVLSLAPEARIWDVPLVGDPTVAPSLSSATAILNRIRGYIGGDAFNGWREAKDPDEAFLSGQYGARCQPWVIVNAWGVFDSDNGLEGMTDRSMHEYGDHPDHFLVNDLPELEMASMDLVFCAGNCGEPCPDGGCGGRDRGPGRSILGLNAHPSVLTVGAVRVDGVPIGQSSQGPGRLAAAWVGSEADKAITPPARRTAYARAALEKPDIAAPSYFRDTDDESQFNRGTSAACAVAAGVVAALRSLEAASGEPRMTPAELREILRDTAAPARGQALPWDPRLGRGIINVPAAIGAVKTRHGLP
jgi:subtilisin family serine protease